MISYQLRKQSQRDDSLHAIYSIRWSLLSIGLNSGGV